MSPDTLRERAAELLEVDRWPRERLLDLQRTRLREVLEHAVAHSPYYREALGPDAADASLTDLPTLPKRVLMDRFDEVVTVRGVRLEKLRSFLSTSAPGDRYLGAYRVFATSGSTGLPGFFPYSHEEFDQWVAVGLAAFARVGVTPETRLVAIGAPGDVHITRQLFASFQAGREGVPRLSVATPTDEMVAALNGYRPEAMIGYASVMGMLAAEQLEGRLAVEPRLVVAGSEVLTEETTRRIEQAWGITPVNVYAATEAPGIAIGSRDQVGMHLFENMVVLENVDAAGRPVPAGVPGSKVLLTTLVNRVQPLIRYELSDSVVLDVGPDPSGRPYTRVVRVDGRSDDILAFPRAGGGTVDVHPHRLRAPFSALVDVLQYQIVHQRDGGLRVEVVPAPAAPRELTGEVRAALVDELLAAGVAAPQVRVEVVERIEREPGPAAKLKLVRSEAAR
jgi:phenylacetate-coenzyme A ligase PaaK-like adenylate-forming protein